jgi:extracellular elastinolytic metalloproteinase
MLTPPDGNSPTMNMGLVTNTNRHTAFDATVVFHEYMHGVTNRLVGGPMNTQALQEPQSKSMGEGWGDYLSCTLTNRIVVGSWVTNQPNGIRSAPYDSNYPGHFGQIGQGIYTTPHRVGEIWCAALLEMNRNLNTRLGTPRGQRLALQLVIDALKLAPANPNMLEMRDSIVKALDDKRNSTAGLNSTDHTNASNGIWAAFAKFGMGANARSNGAKFDVVEDFTVPPVGTSPSPPDKPPSPPPASGVVRVQDGERVAIPDGQPDGITRVVRIDAAGKIKRLTVHVDINHPYVGDLRVVLTPPDWTSIVLHDFAFGEPDLVRDYTVESKPTLAPLIGRQAQGDWKLAVSDQMSGDSGALRGWGVEVEFEGGSAAAGFTGEAPTVSISSLARDAQRLLEELNLALIRMAQARTP